VSMNVSNLYKSLRVTDANLKTCILGNFDIVSGNVTPNFPNTGWWYEYFSGDSMNVANTTTPINLKPGEYRFYTNVKLQQPDLGNVGVSDPQIKDELVLQSYPNPAGEMFTVDFYLPVSADTRLELFDLTGRKIKTIADKKFGVGWYTVDVDASDLQSGIYLCKLTSGKLQQMLKVEVEK